MVLEQRPDEFFLDTVSRGVKGLRNLITSVSEIIRTGDDTIRDLDDALTGGRPRFGEQPQETFMTVLEMLQGTLQDARENRSADAPSVVQKSREILNRINQVEPSWRPGPMSERTASDSFRLALRDLRGSNSLVRLAQGRGTVEDLNGLAGWADDLKTRIDSMKSPASSQKVQASSPSETTRPKAKKTKKDTTPKTTPNPDEVRFAHAVAEEYGDNKVKGWAKEYADGKISEQQWVSRLTTHAAGERESLDEILERANQRIARENDANKETQPEEN